MQTETLLYIIGSGIISLLLAVFQYLKKNTTLKNMVFIFLRFLSIFSVLLLLINPKFEDVVFTSEKPELILAIDNSSSIKHLKKDEKTINFYNKIVTSKKLNAKFNISTYLFGNEISNSDSITFTDKQTNISRVFNQLSQIHKETAIAPTVLVTDGNQTYGNDYQFAYSTFKQPIYPVILGDTITYTDLKISQLNINKYAYLKNRFPVEVIVVYSGNEKINSKLVVTKGETTVFTKSISFSKNKNSQILNFTLPANSIGVSSYKAKIIPIKNEKNIINNSKHFAIEVIDQKTKIAVVSDFSHPDLGTLKKSIESNEQRSVTFLNSKSAIEKINDFQLFIINQPSNKFKYFLEKLNQLKKNSLYIIGPKTDLNFINANNSFFTVDVVNQVENYQAKLNVNYEPFLIDDINFESFPPLNSNYGRVNFKLPFQTVLEKTISGVSINEPLLATAEINKKKIAVLFGENIWKWRAQSFINSKSFNEFDNFIGKIIQYTSSNKLKSRLNINYDSFYAGSDGIIINAQFFDKNYIFDAREKLKIILKDKLSNTQKVIPFILKNNNYQVDLSGLPPSKYDFTVKATKENISKSGAFQVLEYNIEQQFLNANVSKLEQLAVNSNGKSYFIDNTENIINNLVDDNRYVSVQKSHKNIIPLIDWKYLLAIITLSLATEWFLRKYNGLI